MSTENPRKFVMTPCPTCVYLGITKGDGEGGILFWQSAPTPGFYECDYEDHFFDEQTLEMILEKWPAAPPTDQPAEQARQAKGDSQSRSEEVFGDRIEGIG